jgi:ABC-type polysaccharide/polyol phosphate export permease
MTTGAGGDDALVYDVVARSGVRSGVRELLGSGEVVWAFASRAFRLRYKQVVLGLGWSVLQPLAYLAVFVVVFGRVAGIPGRHSSYAAEALAALIGWQLVAGTLSLGASAVVNEAGVLRKVYFPREAPVIGIALTSVVDAAVNLVLFLVLALVLGVTLTPWMLLAPALLLLVIVLALAIALPLAALNVYYRDVRFFLPLFLQVWLFLSPVAYPLDEVPAGWRTAYELLNPLVGPIDGLRRVLTGGTAPDWGLLSVSTAETLGLLIAGYWLFKRLEPEFADVV